MCSVWYVLYQPWRKHSTSLPTSQSVVFIPRPLPLIICVPLQSLAFTVNVPPCEKGQINVYLCFSYTLLLPQCITLFVNVCTWVWLLFIFKPFALCLVIYDTVSLCFTSLFLHCSICHLCFLLCIIGLENIWPFGCIRMLLAWFHTVVWKLFFLAPTFVRGCFLRLGGNIFLCYCANNWNKSYNWVLLPAADLSMWEHLTQRVITNSSLQTWSAQSELLWNTIE